MRHSKGHEHQSSSTLCLPASTHLLPMEPKKGHQIAREAQSNELGTNLGQFQYWVKRFRCAHAGFRGVSHRCRDHRHQSVDAELGESSRQSSATGRGRWEDYGRGGVECVLARRGGEESEHSSVVVCHSLCFGVTVWEFRVYCEICAMYLVRASWFLNLMRVRRVVVVCSPSFENFDVSNYYVMFNF
jgi:hypothetical protein